MKTLVWSLVCLSLPVAAQSSQYIEEQKKHWSTAKEFTLAVADVMPATEYGFKPNPEEMSFGEMAVHIAQANFIYCSRASGLKSPFVKPENNDKPAAAKLIGESFDFCIGAIGGMKAGDLDKMMGPEGRQMSAREALWGGFTHTAHHRAQLEVYLRVKGLKPPDYKF